MTEAVKAERQNGENMGHIYYIMGKSASGKDSVFRVLAQIRSLDFGRL